MRKEKNAVSHRERCPKCAAQGMDTSQDNLVVYSNGTTWCFSCNSASDPTHIPSPNIPQVRTPKELITTHQYVQLKNWGISESVCKKASYGVATLSSGQKVHVADYRSQFNEVVAQKIRTADKKMWITGDPDEMGLWLSHLWNPNEKIPVVITEGEKDALTILECMGDFPVVSIPKGSSDACRTLKANLEWLMGFKNVVLAFDTDPAGVEATQECVDLFEPGLVRIAKWPRKDAHEVYMELGPEAVRKAVISAPTLKPDGIVSWRDIKDQVLAKPVIGKSWPWAELDDWTYGIRPGELITVMAGAGIGKTNFLSEVVLNLVYQQKIRCGMMSFEQAPHKTYQRMIGKVLNVPIYKPDSDWDPSKIKQIGEELDDYLYCYDHSGLVNIQDVKKRLRYYVKGADCDVVIVDNLSNIAAKFDTDERRGIDKAMLELSSWAMELNITIFLVVHVTKAPKDQKQYDEGRELSLSDTRGSSAIEQHSTYVLGLERNCKHQEEYQRRLMTVRCLKDREFDSRGNSLILQYNTKTGRLETDLTSEF